MSAVDKRFTNYGIFCLEGEWETDLTDRRSVLPLLDMLERLGVAPYIHRDFGTEDELARYLRIWGNGYRDFPVLYLASHGDRGVVACGDGDIDLPTIASLIGRGAAGRTVYFGSCLTAYYAEDLKAFVGQTHAAAVVGYRKTVDWLESSAFDLLLLERLTRGTGAMRAFNGVMTHYRDLAVRLDLVVATKAEVRYAPNA